ncbi:hypothetical protein RI129_012888 [Pyrocoelia pectoralis]|uniref:Eukaryotic translation initiation factor 4E transporter n=1 Tax=Pyrocoelia pectoralis TaxID=417401 RepID=A0AAN7V0D7_9COLE
MSVSTTTSSSATITAPAAEDDTKKMDPTKDRDEHMDGLSLALNMDASEFNDPAILAAKPGQPVYRYTREELLQLRQVPLSQKRSEHLSNAFNNPNGIWDPELLHRSTNETLFGPEPLDIHKRRPGDPRERIRKEQDGIVLSPQRRSFNSGCFVPLKENQRANRQHSPIGGKNDGAHIGHREIPQGTRRIGSGRILSRDVPWDFQEKQAVDNDFGYRRDDRFERRSFGRDYDMNKDKDKHGRNNRFNERRRIPSENRDEEPEWFSGGPVSQADTIELRGFDDSDCEKIGKKKLSNAQKKRLKERGTVKTVESQLDAKDREDTTKTKTNTPDVVPIMFGKQSPILEDKEDSKKNSTEDNTNSFNFDDILKCDTIANLLPNGVSGNDGDTSGSRFSQWFKRESPKQTQNSDSRRSSLQDDHIIRNLLNDINISEPNVTIPGDSDSYFAPISPAANTGNSNLKFSSQKPFNLMEMLQRGKSESHTKNLDVNSKVLSLAELEARIIHQGAGDPGTARNSLPKQTKSADEVNAFKRLLAQVSDGQAVTASNGPLPSKSQSMSLMELLSHSQQQDEAAGLSAASHLIGSSSPNIHNDVAFKLHLQNHVQAQIQQRQQAQMEMLNKLINANAHRQQLGTSPLHEMTLNQSRELLSRPEAQAILQAIHQRIPSPRELQVHTQNIMQQALIKKKLEEQTENYKKRQEMQHRGQSPGRGLSPVKHNMSSPTPLAFTPTSVLRKMTADKEDANKDASKSDIFTKMPPGRAVTGMKPSLPQQQHQSQTWNMQQQLKQPVGRPIVKANANLQTTQQDQQYFHQQHQRLYNHQQQQARKLGQFPSINPSQAGASSHQPLHLFSTQHSFSSNPQQFQQQLTQHQLRAQHQQHQPPQQNQYNSRSNSQTLWSSQQQHALLTSSNYDGRISHMGDRGGANNNGGDLSPTSNQLARWFSPELLERARAGKVPNLPSTNTSQHAISLEELERQTAPPVHN